MLLNSQNWIKFAFGLLLGARLVGSAFAGMPAFVSESIYSSNRAKVLAIEPNLAADLVVLEGGLDQGIRLGMLCLVERGTQSIGELIIVESGSNCSAALILELTDNLTIQPGDVVRIKTFQNS